VTNDQLYSELYDVITDIINEFVKGGGDPDAARRMAFDATRSALNCCESGKQAECKALNSKI